MYISIFGYYIYIIRIYNHILLGIFYLKNIQHEGKPSQNNHFIKLLARHQQIHYHLCYINKGETSIMN